MQQMKKIALASVLAMSGSAHAWTLGTEGTATLSGQITGAAPITWEALSGGADLGKIDMNDFNKVGNQYVYQKKVSKPERLFHIRMKEAGKVAQLYDPIKVRYLDKDGKALTLAKSGGAWDGTFQLQLPAHSPDQLGTTMALTLPLKTDSVIKVLTTDKTKYAVLGSATFASSPAMFDGMACPTDQTCWLGQQTFGTHDPDIGTYVEAKLPKGTATLTNPAASSRYLEMKFDAIGANAKPGVQLGGLDSAFKTDTTDLVLAASLLIDSRKDLTMTASSDAIAGDWQATLNVEVSTL